MLMATPRPTGNRVGRTNFEEQIEVGECLLLFGAESLIFQFAIKKVKDKDI